ncbi:YibE/F family protein [Microlunatus flavus]|uniref:Uncharacterized membrane protein n=1 Tax=Microlunatus flavus TaxID=1036181 RepID=A0A1H9AXZ0_9ACTN|nr:YibE/F family protein [Microlunatus flavus]SEP81626.1 Uncharacterized membrane protein [Microlunatus flavus]
MAHSHSNAARAGRGAAGHGPEALHESGHQVTGAELYRHRRALRILIVVLIPLGVWTLVGLLALWPGDVSSHVNADAGGYSVPGVTYPHAEITAVEPIACDGLPGSTPGQSGVNACATITTTVTDGDGKGDVASVPLTQAVYASGADVGDGVTLIRVPPGDGQPASYQFSDFDRRTPLVVMTILFALVVVAVARWRGLASLVGLGFAAVILVKFMFPALVEGQNPVVVGLIGSSAIMFVVLYAAHGFSARTTTALVGTLFGLILSAALGWGATRWAHLTGVATEDDYLLAASTPDLRLTSVVICGIIVAGLGVLNDVTITQASAVWELADGHYLDENGKALRLRNRDLFARAMRIGRDHIASTVYTIAFATAGASLSVLLLIAVYDRPLLQVLQTEQFSDEIVRTLVGSIGLVLAVPLTTAVGVAVVRAGRVQPAGAALVPSERRARSLLRRRVPQPVGPTEPEVTAGPAAAAPDSDVDTQVLPAVRGTAGTAPVTQDPVADVVSDATERPSRRKRRRTDDDFGDFSDLRDPDEPSPRRSR